MINADDYYGSESFSLIYDYLSSGQDGGKYRWAMAGYLLKNTVTEHGSVSRGVCSADSSGNLVRVVERTRIEQQKTAIRFTEDGGETWQEIGGETLVSMNLWGFTESFVREAWERFPAFLDEALQENPLKGEYFLPSVVSALLEEGRAEVKILPSADKWYGITYREDKPKIVQALAQLARAGRYPEPLWQ